ncbi:MAG: hypothetical protein AB7K08_13305, partial [Microbacteriaceae bacterium]
APGAPPPARPGPPGDLPVPAWPGTARVLLLWETLRPGLALRTLQTVIGQERTANAFAALRGDAEPIDFDTLAGMQEGIIPGAVRALAPEVAWAATLEGYAAAATAAERGMRELAGVTGATLLIGGGLRSRRWIEAKLRRAIHPVAMASEREAVSRGAAIFAGVAAGWWRPEEYPAADVVPMTTGEPVREAGPSRA